MFAQHTIAFGVAAQLVQFDVCRLDQSDRAVGAGRSGDLFLNHLIPMTRNALAVSSKIHKIPAKLRSPVEGHQGIPHRDCRNSIATIRVLFYQPVSMHKTPFVTAILRIAKDLSRHP
ncbi:hypothetical protein YH69_33890 (plasmid) [Pseudomonas aeruginosa]|nr:hypothetical protein YH69_33890 [Pseudomonas aeruginosa]OFC00121.1 hypothetical protein AN472_27645 [Pseudomonas aeruginosa]OFC31357.1 hypothetical protein AN464_27395 [Pseudomonas aeruginosa]